MLSVAQDLVAQLQPYQNALNNALDVMTSLPLVGNELSELNEWNTVFQDSVTSLASHVDTLTNGHFELAIPLPSLSETFTFDLGLDAFLQVNTSGGVSATINPVLNVAFDLTNGVPSLDPAHTGLDIGFVIGLPNFQLTASLNGKLYAQAVDDGTTFSGNLGFNFGTNFGIEANFSGDAHVRLGLSVSLVDPALGASFNPRFVTDLELDWGFDTQGDQLKVPVIAFRNFSLDADSFMQGFLGDTVKGVQKFTKPMQPFIDMFEQPVPIVSSFDSSETMGDLFLKGAGLSAAQQDSFNTMVKIVKAVNTFDFSGTTGGAVINFGDILLTGDARQTGQFFFDTTQLQGVIDDIMNSPALQEVQEKLETVAEYVGFTADAGFKYPLLENPGPVIGSLLTGQTAVMFSYSTGRQHFELGASYGVGIPDLLGFFLNAGIVFDANLSVGYDTAGLLKFIEDPQPESLLHGFYIDNSIDNSGPPIPNVPNPRKTSLYLQGHADISASAVVTVSGGLYADIAFELASNSVSPHVYLDDIITSLSNNVKVFKPSGRLYAAANIELTVPTPVGPDITLFSHQLSYQELLSFNIPPAPSPMLPLTVIDVTNQHTLLLDVTKMTANGRVKVQPFHDFTVTSGIGYLGDGIRVDYPNEIVLYIERKNDITTNYYNLIGLSGAVPDGVSIDIVDPFTVFTTEGAPDPQPPQTESGVLLAGGKNVVYKYTENAGGSLAKVLLVGGYGSNNLSGGTMSFGNFVPAARLDQAKNHFGNLTGFDAGGQAYINARVDSVLAPASPTGIIGATMSGSRGGLMYGGPGNNSFIAAGAGAYEMIGGTWVDSFSISPSFSGGTASYQIDGGPGGGNSLAVRVPKGDLADFENGTVPDRYDPAYKALDIFSNAGLFATAHGIQKVAAFGAAGSTIIFGDTSELNIDFKVVGSAAIKFGGSPAPDDFSVTAQYDQGYFYATKDRHVGPALIPANPDGSGNIHDFDDGLAGFTLVEFPGAYVDGPILSIARTFGTNGRTQIIPFRISDSDQSSITLDGRGASDDYTIDIGVGTFLDLAVDDSDATTQNALTVEFNFLGGTTATLTDTSLHLEYYTPIVTVYSSAGGPNTHYYRTSVFYSPTVSFTANVDIVFETRDNFDQYIVNRPVAPQDAEIRIKPTQLFFPYYAYDPAQPDATLLALGSTYSSIDVQANGGSLLIARAYDDINETAPSRHYDVTIHTNNGQLTLDIDGVWTSGTGSFDFPELVDVLSNAGTINVNHTVIVYPNIPYIGPLQLLDIQANVGTINVFDAITGILGLNPGSLGIDNQVTLGTGGNLTGVHGTINFSNSFGHLGLTLDNRNTPGAISPWTIDRDRTVIGDLTLNYPGLNANGTDGYSKLVVYPKAGSTVVKSDEPSFFIREYHFESANLHTLNFSPPSLQNHKDGNTVSLTLSATTDLGLPITYSATNLPPGLSINPTTGVISGTISTNAYLGSPYQTTVTATAGAFACLRQMPWSVTSGIDISIEAISLSDASLGPLPNSDSYLDPSRRVVSSNGRFVAFYSTATNLVPGDTNNKYDVFVRDRQTGTTTLISGGISAPGNGNAYEPSISGDGRYVAFYSNSTNLVPGGTTGNQVFVRDMQTGTTSLVSTGVNGQGNSTSYSPAISANGRYIAFVSAASNLVPGVGNGFKQIYVRDLQSGTTSLVSTGPNGVGDSQSDYAPAISADGRYIAFTSRSSNLVPGDTNNKYDVFVRDLLASSTTLASTGIGGQANQSCYDVSISADGRHVAFDSTASNLVAQSTNSLSNIYVSDWKTGTITLVSVDSAGQVGNGHSTAPTISATGRYVAFDSVASNFAGGDTNGSQDVFLRDLQTGTTKRISVGSAGEGNSHSFYPSISADGRAVVFNSYADNLVSGFNVHNFGDIYLYFNPLAVADGIFIPGDFSQDGAVDAADYVWLRKYANSQSAYDTWRANFGSTAATGSLALSAGFPAGDAPLVSVVQANVPEVGAEGDAESMDNRPELPIAYEKALPAVAVASAQVTENVLSNESQPISQTPSRAVDDPLDFEFAYSAPFESLFGIRPQRIAMQAARSAVARHDDGLLAWLSSQSLPNSDNTLDDDFFAAVHYNGDQSSEFRFDTIENALDTLLVGDPKSG